MKKITILLCCIVLFTLLGCKKLHNTDKSDLKNNKSMEKFILGLDDTFAPMGFRDENNNIVGFDIDLAKEVTKRMGVKLVLQPIDWSSKELELNNGNIDCIWNGLSVDPARSKAMLLSEPYLISRMVIVVDNKSNINDKQSLKDKHIGVQTGSTAVNSLEKDPISKYITRVDFETNSLALADLKIGRIDAVVVDEVVARYIISKNNLSFKILDDFLDNETYAVAFKKGNNHLAEKFKKVFDEMIQDGTVTEISKKWFGSDIVLRQ